MLMNNVGGRLGGLMIFNSNVDVFIRKAAVLFVLSYIITMSRLWGGNVAVHIVDGL